MITLLLTFLFLLHNTGILSWRFPYQLENILYDSRVLLTMPGDVDPRIVIVDIDEKSLAEVGRWPWSRDKLAEIGINKKLSSRAQKLAAIPEQKFEGMIG